MKTKYYVIQQSHINADEWTDYTGPVYNESGELVLRITSFDKQFTEYYYPLVERLYNFLSRVKISSTRFRIVCRRTQIKIEDSPVVWD